MRRGLASLIIGLSLLLASVSWAGFTLSHTVLDPGRSERLADQLLENPDVRAALVGRMADALESQLPPEVPIPRQVIEAGAETALDDPRVEALIRDGFVQVHQNALAGSAEPVVIDANALGAAGRDVLIDTRPELEEFLPPTPPLELELPTAGLTWLGTVKTYVDRVTLWTAIAAIVGAVTAFGVAHDRAKVLRRVAYWGFGTALFWLAVGFFIPWAASTLSPTSAAIATAVVDVFFGAMIQPALALVVFASIMLLASFLWPAAGRRRGAARLQPRSATGTRTVQPRRDNTDEMARPVVADLRAATAPALTSSTGPGRDSTQVMQTPVTVETASAPPPVESSGPAWEEGRGYLDEQRSSPFTDAEPDGR